MTDIRVRLVLPTDTWHGHACVPKHLLPQLLVERAFVKAVCGSRHYGVQARTRERQDDSKG